MQTELTLMTRDGAVFLAFRPPLSANQYAALLEMVASCCTAEEMRMLAQSWASKEGLTVLFDEAVASRPPSQ